MKATIFFYMGLLGLMAWSSTAWALGPCGPAEALFKTLRDKHKERIVFSGTDAQGREYYGTMSPTGSWTFFFTFYTKQGDHVSCMLGAGGEGKVRSFHADPGEPV